MGARLRSAGTRQFERRARRTRSRRAKRTLRHCGAVCRRRLALCEYVDFGQHLAHRAAVVVEGAHAAARHARKLQCGGTRPRPGTLVQRYCVRLLQHQLHIEGEHLARVVDRRLARQQLAEDDAKGEGIRLL